MIFWLALFSRLMEWRRRPPAMNEAALDFTYPTQTRLGLRHGISAIGRLPLLPITRHCPIQTEENMRQSSQPWRNNLYPERKSWQGATLRRYTGVVAGRLVELGVVGDEGFEFEFEEVEAAGVERLQQLELSLCFLLCPRPAWTPSLGRHGSLLELPYPLSSSIGKTK